MQFIKGHFSTLAIILLILILAGVSVVRVVSERERAAAPASQALTVGPTEAGFTDLSGNPVPLTDRVGAVLVVNSWASWSPDSAVELPRLAAVAAEYEAEGVRVVAINRAEIKETAERFLRTVDAYDQVELVLDPDDHYYRSIGGYAMPETIFYDAAGEIVHHHRGVMREIDIRNYLDAALAASKDTE